MIKGKINAVMRQHGILFIILKIMLTTIFAVTIFLDSILEFVPNIRGSIDEIYFSKVKIENILIFIATWIITYIVLTCIIFLLPRVEKYFLNKTENQNNPKKIKFFWITFGILLLLWAPYILTFFPGGIFADTLASIKQCLHLQPYDNANPLAYTLLIKICLKIGELFNSYQIGINIFSVCQITVMALSLSYFIYWLYKKNISKWILFMLIVFFGIFKLIPLYAISIWKDTPFSIALFLYIICIAEIVYQNGKNLNNKKTIVPYVLFLVASGFLRNNGKYVILATTIILLIVYRKQRILKFAVSSITACLIVFVVQGPVFTLLGLNDSNISFNAIMTSQIFYVKVKDGNITDEQNEIINKMCEEGALKKVYSPILLDPVSISPEFDRNYVVEHQNQIKKLWFELFVQNPLSYMKSYLLITLGFWDVNKEFVDAYMSIFMWPGTEEIIDVHQTNVIEQLAGFSVRKMLAIQILYSSAIFVFAMLTSMLFVVYKKEYKKLLIYLPGLFVWGTIMVATPIAFSLRYVYILVLMVPLDFIIPFLKCGDENENT